MRHLAHPENARALMASSRSVAEWNHNCRLVANAISGESESRRRSIEKLLTGPLYARTAARFGDR